MALTQNTAKALKRFEHFVFLHLPAYWLRTGSAYTSNGIVEFVKQLLSSLPNRMRIIVRADSVFFDGALLDLLDAHGHGYLIKVKLKNLVGLLTRQ